jgi:hypothetical protein
MLQIVMHAGRKSAIDGYTRRQPYSPKAHWISCPCDYYPIHTRWGNGRFDHLACEYSSIDGIRGRERIKALISL